MTWRSRLGDVSEFLSVSNNWPFSVLLEDNYKGFMKTSYFLKKIGQYFWLHWCQINEKKTWGLDSDWPKKLSSCLWWLNVEKVSHKKECKTFRMLRNDIPYKEIWMFCVLFIEKTYTHIRMFKLIYVPMFLGCGDWGTWKTEKDSISLHFRHDQRRSLLGAELQNFF